MQPSHCRTCELTVSTEIYATSILLRRRALVLAASLPGVKFFALWHSAQNHSNMKLLYAGTTLISIIARIAQMWAEERVEDGGLGGNQAHSIGKTVASRLQGQAR